MRAGRCDRLAVPGTRDGGASFYRSDLTRSTRTAGPGLFFAVSVRHLPWEEAMSFVEVPSVTVRLERPELEGPRPPGLTGTRRWRTTTSPRRRCGPGKGSGGLPRAEPPATPRYLSNSVRPGQPDVRAGCRVHPSRPQCSSTVNVLVAPTRIEARPPIGNVTTGEVCPKSVLANPARP